MQNHSIVLNSARADDERVEKKQWGLIASTHPSSKGTTMVALLIILGIIAVAAIVGTFALLSNDGYGRTPKREYVRIF